MQGSSGEQRRKGQFKGWGLSYRDGQRAPGWGLSGVGPVRVGRTALWKHGRKTSWCIRLSRGGGGVEEEGYRVCVSRYCKWGESTDKLGIGRDSGEKCTGGQMSFVWYQNIVFAAFFPLLSFQVEGRNKNNVRSTDFKRTAAAVVQG